LDTRRKIVEPRSLPSEGPVRVIVGYFDPVHGEQARAVNRLANEKEVVVAAVMDPPNPLLPLRARAELAAALEAIDFVVTEADEALALPGATVIDIRADDLRRRDELMRHVVRRHGAE
jgi:sugar/nucleoside kinase (ribokinase family)